MNSKHEISTQQDSIWQRALFMLLFAFLSGISKVVIFTVAALQFLILLMTSSPNQPLLELGQSLSRYTYQIMQYLTFNSDVKPYPFSDWPVE